ncbi:type III secretion system translocon protein, YopD/IpaC/EspB family [Pseudomonas sp. NFACC24-1]|nr:type III secretion system translocon protein, YopD/IpaC/EspB family [Pseudomonas sp. NFACC24-1]
MMISIHAPTLSGVLKQDSVDDARLSERTAQQQLSSDLEGSFFSNPVVLNRIVATQILRSDPFTAPSAAQLKDAIDAYQPTQSDWEDLGVALTLLNDEVRNDLIFDPGAWEKHANVLVAAIIALNVARVTNAQLRGHFTVMASEAAKAQGAAIIESGQAALYSAITGAVVSGAVAGFAMVKTLHGHSLKHADINLHKRNAMEAGNLERDLKRDRYRDDWDPQTHYKINTFDDFGRIKTVDFQPKGSSLPTEQQAWFDAEILKAQKVGQTSDWLSQMGSKGIEKKLEIGRALSAMSMNLGQVLSKLVGLSEHTAREKDVLQQSAQNSQKALSDEVSQKDAAEAALLQKLMEIVMQLFQSRAAIIQSLTA